MDPSAIQALTNQLTDDGSKKSSTRKSTQHIFFKKCDNISRVCIMYFFFSNTFRFSFSISKKNILIHVNNFLGSSTYYFEDESNLVKANYSGKKCHRHCSPYD